MDNGNVVNLGLAKEVAEKCVSAFGDCKDDKVNIQDSFQVFQGSGKTEDN